MPKIPFGIDKKGYLCYNVKSSLKRLDDPIFRRRIGMKHFGRMFDQSGSVYGASATISDGFLGTQPTTSGPVRLVKANAGMTAASNDAKPAKPKTLSVAAVRRFLFTRKQSPNNGTQGSPMRSYSRRSRTIN